MEGGDSVHVSGLPLHSAAPELALKTQVRVVLPSAIRPASQAKAHVSCGPAPVQAEQDVAKAKSSNSADVPAYSPA
jgi:hypothetical protein